MNKKNDLNNQNDLNELNKQNSQSHFFQNKKALITGGTKGLGLAVAELLAEKGTELFLSYRRDEEGARQAQDKILSTYGVQCHILQSDLSTEEGLLDLYRQVRLLTDRLDFYVHNAAATAFKDLLQLSGQNISKTLHISIHSLILGVQQLVPLMSRGGSIVTISGMDTLRIVPRHGLLAAAKAALENLTSYLAVELAPHNIRVNGVNPGFLPTQSTQIYFGQQFDLMAKMIAGSLPQKRLPRLEEVARTILFLLSEDASWMVGQTIIVDGGQNLGLGLGMGIGMGMGMPGNIK